MAFAVHGIGPVSSLGSGTAQLRRGLEGRMHENEPGPVSVEGSKWSIPVYQPLLEGIDTFFSSRALRRADDFSKTALLSAALAIQDSGLNLEGKNVGVIFGSGYGPLKTTFQFLDNIIDDGDSFASPQHFAASVHNAPASQISALNRFQGPCATLTTFNDTVSGVFTAVQGWFETGQADYVLAGFGDEHCHVLYYAAEALGSPGQKMNPLEFESCTYLPGGGAVSFLLSPADETAAAHVGLEGLNVEPRSIRGESLETPEGIVLSARGEIRESEPFAALNLGDHPVTAYTPLFGAFPVSAAMDIACALIGVKDGLFYAGPPQKSSPLFTCSKAPISLKPDSAISVLEPSASGGLHHYRITR
jgi:3-oxoacyl-[acyl-carrier-protein] synthase II